MDPQTAFNIGLSIIGGLTGWLLKILWGNLDELKRQDEKLAEKVSAIEILVAGEYVKKDDFDKKLDSVMNKLDRIENKLDHKADKGDRK